jgi:hypothetical protein
MMEEKAPPTYIFAFVDEMAIALTELLAFGYQPVARPVDMPKAAM